MPQFHQHTFDNGLTLLAEADPAAHTAAIGFFVRTGARDETPQIMGVSHFLEHMMFKGTDRRAADDVNREFDEIGANYNAFTSHEQTVYYAHVLPEYLARATDLIGDMLRPSLRKADFDLEKNVILEEIGMYDDRPQWRLQDAILERYFGPHPLGFRVLGTRDTVAALTDEQMRRYFERRYAPDNIVIAAGGRVDFAALVDQVGAIGAGWAPAGDAATGRDYLDPAPVEQAEQITDPKVTRHYIGMLCPAPSAQDPLRYAAKVLADVLGDAEGSRLYWSLVDPGLADEADFSFQPHDRTGYHFAYASCAPERAERVEQTLIRVIDTIGDDLNDAEVLRANNKLATVATVQGERPAGRMMSLGSTWSYLGEYLPLEEELRRLQAVTLDDLRQLLADRPLSPRCLLRLGPG
jgi:predicted Zn-dependent peptidase